MTVHVGYTTWHIRGFGGPTNMSPERVKVLTTQLVFRAPAELREALERDAAENGRTVAQSIRYHLRRSLGGPTMNARDAIQTAIVEWQTTEGGPSDGVVRVRGWRAEPSLAEYIAKRLPEMVGGAYVGLPDGTLKRAETDESPCTVCPRQRVPCDGDPELGCLGAGESWRLVDPDENREEP
jgi:hypothetical protein